MSMTHRGEKGDAQDTHLTPYQPTTTSVSTLTGPSDVRAAVAIERRASLRSDCDLAALWVPAASPRQTPWRQGRIRNLSAGGMLLLLDELVVRGTVLMVEVKTADLGLPCQLVVQALHARPTPEGWAVGCMLAAELREHHLRQLLG
jgi:hypothetical protein